MSKIGISNPIPKWVTVVILLLFIAWAMSSCVYAPGDDDAPITCDDIEKFYDKKIDDLYAPCDKCDLTSEVKVIEKERINKLRAIGCQTREN